LTTANKKDSPKGAQNEGKKQMKQNVLTTKILEDIKCFFLGIDLSMKLEFLWMMDWTIFPLFGAAKRNVLMIVFHMLLSKEFMCHFPVFIGSTLTCYNSPPHIGGLHIPNIPI
jgi:hypothetical protein